MNKTAGTRVYACEIVPFFVFCSVALRTDLVLDSVISREISSMTCSGGSEWCGQVRPDKPDTDLTITDGL